MKNNSVKDLLLNTDTQAKVNHVLKVFNVLLTLKILMIQL